jgi:glycine/D-amino acid oxidase-like deaminating enzyme
VAALEAGPADGGNDGRATGLTAAPLDAVPPDDSIPPTSSDDLTARARHLLEAVGKDDADLATDILFPRDGWLATRDAADPGKEWEKHVAGPFRKSVHAYARHHEELDRAQFVSLELGHVVVQSTPRRHGWKKPLWTVKGSRLTFLVNGHTRTLSIREMTAWRGAWYVTRLR